jgi:hypothetical protein
MTQSTETEDRRYLESAGVIDILRSLEERSQNSGAFQPHYADLVRMHRLVRVRKATTILEFGVGFSTLVMGHALLQNCRDFGDAIAEAGIRQSNLFEIHSIDTSAHWLDQTRYYLPEELDGIVHLHHSPARIGTFADRICHYYSDVPNICPNFIYLDGPDPSQVEGHLDGVRFDHPDRTPVSADILRMEYLLLPGTMILVDGRTNNARFLKDHFRRDFRHRHDVEGDVHTFELIEPPLGKLNKRHIEFCHGEGWPHSTDHA